MDCQMPNMDGYDATKLIRGASRNPEVPIIAVTANAFPEDRERCLQVGMNAYLKKPVSLEQIKTVLHELPERRGKLSHRESYNGT